MKKQFLAKATTLSILSLSLLLPGTSYAYANVTNGTSSYASYEMASSRSSSNELELMKNDIKNLLEENLEGSSRNFDEMSKFVSPGDIEFIHHIIELKKEKPQLTPEEIVGMVFTNHDNVQTRGLLSEAGQSWNNLTTDEKWLVAMYPAEALIVNAAKNNTDALTNSYYPGWKDGDKGNAFRHALWNAIMALNITKNLAEKFATAHENHGLTDDQYRAEVWNGFNGLQHRAMDLHNNGKGRDCVSWYEIPYAVSNTDLAERVQTKINNGEMIILKK
ncbi:hypothetical protein NV379_21725 [Paenibacillus sp. N1-5-1-14]|uniref:DUF6973 domain-containing protein n=1 Tax=Paenibacillus radicibacter TaxID=2972488 RepID=UPI002159B37A|nr:hypothetical protein [Paenibacillus radicibacter]MCR8645280.1 hypothetical protein [Paenibacillus radicibacter]